MGQDQGQDVLNRWHWVNPAGTADPTAVLAPFTTTVLTPMLAWCAAGFRWNSLVWRVITDPLSAQASYATGYPLISASATQAAESFVAVSAKWTFGSTVILTPEVPQRRIRRGGKRMGGIPQTFITGNVLNAAEVSQWKTLLEAYVGMSDGGWLPCIAGFPVQPPKGTDPDNIMYQTPNKYARINDVLVSAFVGSQVSRKHGHGK